MAEDRMDLFIETLTGTAFELRVSPFETIISIKGKIQYLEGIPISQQHLIWHSQELEDDLCLQDYSIVDGATLRLVLGMRGGPVNTYRVPAEESLQELADYVEERRDQLRDGVPNGRPFTVLVFRDGDKVHMYTLLDSNEEIVSPLSGSASDSSSVKHLTEEDVIADNRQRENEVTREKMAILQEKIKSLTVGKPRRRIPPLHSRTTKSNKKCVFEQNALSENSSTGQRLKLPPLQPNTALVCGNMATQKNSEHKVSLSDDSIMSQCSSNTLPNIPTAHCRNFVDSSVRCTKGSTKTDISRINQSVNSEVLHQSINSASKKTEVENCVSVPNTKEDVKKSEPGTCQLTSETDKAVSLPYITSSQVQNVKAHSIRRSIISLPRQNSTVFSVNTKSPYKFVKYATGIKSKYPCRHTSMTSNPPLATQRFLELDQWFDARPKTTPHENIFKHLDSLLDTSCNTSNSLNCDKSHHHELPLNYSSNEKTLNPLIHSMKEDKNLRWKQLSPLARDQIDFPHTSGQEGFKTLLTAELNVLKSPRQREAVHFGKQKNFGKHMLIKPHSQDGNKICSEQKLPPVKVKKKCHKRCTWCNKRTGLATSYVCRCGKNFCATHRYAELHHCTYDYKAEGRRLLQQGNPVITASKLPKI